jgi:hypothetical protein
MLPPLAGQRMAEAFERFFVMYLPCALHRTRTLRCGKFFSSPV